MEEIEVPVRIKVAEIMALNRDDTLTLTFDRRTGGDARMPILLGARGGKYVGYELGESASREWVLIEAKRLKGMDL